MELTVTNVRALQAEGKTLNEISALVGISRQRLAHYCHVNGVSVASQMVDEGKLREMVAMGLNNDEIAMKFSTPQVRVTAGVVKAVLGRLGFRCDPNASHREEDLRWLEVVRAREARTPVYVPAMSSLAGSRW